MRKLIAVSVLGLGLMAGSVFAEEESKINFTGIVDMDVWADMNGNFYNNDDNTVTMEVKLSEKVTGYLGMTIVTGGIPAGPGLPSARWNVLGYDGAWLSYAVSEGLSVTVGDVLYQYGGFNYYLYKYCSMITPEAFIRGVEVTKALGSMELDFMAGSVDADGTFGYALSLGVPMGENMKLSLYNATQSGPGSSPLAAGAEFTGMFGMLELKADFGFNTDAAVDSADPSIAVLVEPSVALTEDFSVAATFYYQDDKGTLLSTYDDMFVYVEPCYSFNDGVALGLPLEFHDSDADLEDDESIWVVPTLYLYPADDTEIWLWGQMVLPMADGADPEYYVGSELIYGF